MLATVRTLDTTLFEGTITGVQLETEAGRIEVRDGHEPIIGVVKAGVMILNGDTTTELATGKGVLYVTPDNSILVLCDAGARDAELDEAQILAAKEAAEDYLKNPDSTDPDEYARVQALLDLELAKLDLVKRRNRPKF